MPKQTKPTKKEKKEIKTEEKAESSLSKKTRRWLKKLDVSSPEKAQEPLDPYQIILHPLSTEKSIRQIEFDNKLTFVVNRKANKPEIKRAVEDLFKVKVLKVNLQNSFKGQKRAYIKLSPESLASDVSADLGLI